MRFLMLVAAVSLVLAADPEAKVELKAELKEELKPEESAHRHDGHSFSDGLELIRYREQRKNSERYRIAEHGDELPFDRNPDHHDLPGPVILRTPGILPHDGHPDIEAQNKIIQDVFSPDYYQPTWVLDYRYLKTGGRDYTRGPGGQILILPKGVRSKEPKEFPDYDTYLEHLRLSRLSEKQHNRHGYDYGHDYEHERWQNPHGHHRGQGRRGHDGHHDNHGHGQTMWSKYG